MKRFLLSVLCMLAASAVSFAQSTPVTQPHGTSFTVSAYPSVPKTVETEHGVTVQPWSGGVSSLNTMAKYSFSGKTQAVVSYDAPMLRGNAFSLADTAELSLKQCVYCGKTGAVSVLAIARVPTQVGAKGSGGAALVAQKTWGTITPTIKLTCMREPERRWSGSWGFDVGYQATSRLQIFVGYYGQVLTAQRYAQGAEFGVMYQVRPNIALDVSSQCFRPGHCQVQARVTKNWGTP